MKTRIGLMVCALLLLCSTSAMSQDLPKPQIMGPVKISDVVKKMAPADLAAWEVIGTVGGYNQNTQTFDKVLLVAQVRNIGQFPWTGTRTVTLTQTKNGVTVKTEKRTISYLGGGEVFSFEMVVSWDTLNNPQGYGCRLTISPGDKNAANDVYNCTAAAPPVIK